MPPASLRRFVALLLSAFAAWNGAAQKSSALDRPLHVAIDRQIESALPKFKLTQTAERADDAEFLRRVSLDLTGVIPTADEVRAFAADKSPDKRTALIDQLLASDEYARHLAVVFDVMLMERRPDEHVTSAEWRNYLAESFRKNKPLDALVREILISDGLDPATRPAASSFSIATRSTTRWSATSVGCFSASICNALSVTIIRP